MEWSPGPGIKVGEKSRSAARRHVRKRPQASQCGLNVPDDAERLILATGRYIGEGFDDARLDMLFLRDCQEFCAVGHDDEKERIITWLSRKNFWTSSWLDVIHPRFSARTVCWTI
ncbi:hypothetical protein [Sinorhizobium meliloti]|uniref:hypothetical protein n=1 Tax=Rhizobium meliloti TaxID=382 RepID=UPI0013923DCC|nr:hypothetical protein [Sinorhizobium meliloti]